MRSLPQDRRDRLRRLAATAALYVEAIGAGRRDPNESVAEAQGRPMRAVRDDIYAARREGLLTGSVRRGRPGGQLTPRAHEILGSDGP
jgi:hypothetical protein